MTHPSRIEVYEDPCTDHIVVKNLETGEEVLRNMPKGEFVEEGDGRET